MKKLILFLSLGMLVQDLSAQSSTESARRRKRLSSKTNKTNTRPNTVDTFHSRNGKMKAHTMSKEEELVREKEKINATQVNHGINENMPPLSPSNGNAD